MHKTAIVTGAGIVGLAMARALAIKGYNVTVIERSPRAMGASVRNFGMIWPVGQPDGELYERAMRSSRIWKETCSDAKIWFEQAGSLHLAFREDELDVLNELAAIYKNREYRVLQPKEVIQLSPFAAMNGLKGALYSRDEVIVDPRAAIHHLPAWLEEKYKVKFIWGRTVTEISSPDVYFGDEMISADRIFVCNGADFETLYPRLFAEQQIIKCKLQMMRLMPPAEKTRIGPALCGGLSLLHYRSFKVAPSLSVLQNRYRKEMEEYLDYGIHVMVSQNHAGELTVGDSHEYSHNPDPFCRQHINQLIIEYLKKITRFNCDHLLETWNGVYAKMTNGETELLLQPEQAVMIVNGLGGAGMTLSFGLAEEICDEL